MQTHIHTLQNTIHTELLDIHSTLTHSIPEALLIRIMRVLMLSFSVGSIILLAMYLNVSNEIATLGYSLQGLQKNNVTLQKRLEQTMNTSSEHETMFSMKSNPYVQRMPKLTEKRFAIINDGKIQLMTYKLPDKYIPLATKLRIEI